MIKCTAIIPARSGSKGVPDKNIKYLAGKPLISYSIAAAYKSEMINRIIVSTDSEKYAEIAIEEGAEVPFLRPKEYSQDLSKDSEFFVHLVSWLEKNEKKVPEFFVHLRPTTPLRKPKIIDDAIITFINYDYTALRSVHEMPQSAYKYFELQNKKLIQIFSKDSNLDFSNQARQIFPKTFCPNGYVDIVRSELIGQNILHGDNVYGLLTERTYEIDSPEDFAFMEYYIKKNNILFKNLFEQ